MLWLSRLGIPEPLFVRSCVQQTWNSRVWACGCDISENMYIYIYSHIYIYIYSRYIIDILIYLNIFYIDNTYTAWGFSLHFLRKRRACPSFSSSAQGPHLQNAKGVETWRYHGPQTKKQRIGPVVTQKRCFFCDQRTASQLTNAADSTATLEESAWWILEITKILWPRHLLP